MCDVKRLPSALSSPQTTRTTSIISSLDSDDDHPVKLFRIGSFRRLDVVELADNGKSKVTIPDESVDDILNNVKSPWFSLGLCYVLMLFSGVQFSIYFTSMWPYLLSMDPDVNLYFYGFVIASFSFGQMLASPAFGYWSQRTKSTKYPVIFGMLITSVGNLLYALLPNIGGTQSKWFMLVARFLVGIGSGLLGVLRAYIATASSPRDRVKAIALGMSMFVVGIAVGPGLQTAFQPIGLKGFRIGPLHLNMYTLPSYFVIAIAWAAVALLLTLFREQYSGILSTEQRKDSHVVLPKFDKRAAYACIFFWFVQQSVGTNNEVLATPYTISMYNWSDEDAILYNGIIQVFFSLMCLLGYLALAWIKPLQQVDHRKMMVIGLLTFALYHLLTIPWPFYPETLDYEQPISIERNISSKIGGCALTYRWCATTRRVPQPLYIFAYVVVLGAAYPIITIPLGALFSRVLGPRKQGNMQGLFTFFGSLARCVSPFVASNMFEHFGPIVPWAVEIALIAAAIALIGVFFNRQIGAELRYIRTNPISIRLTFSSVCILIIVVCYISMWIAIRKRRKTNALNEAAAAAPSVKNKFENSLTRIATFVCHNELLYYLCMVYAFFILDPATDVRIFYFGIQIVSVIYATLNAYILVGCSASVRWLLSNQAKSIALTFMRMYNKGDLR